MYDTFFVAINIHLFIYFYFISSLTHFSIPFKYVYVEAATITAAPSHVLSRIKYTITIQYMFTWCGWGSVGGVGVRMMVTSDL